MYSTHEFHPKVCESYLSLGDPYDKSRFSDPRYKGRQFQTVPSKTGQIDGYFSRVEHLSSSGADGVLSSSGSSSKSNSSFLDSTAYRHSQPRSERKLGFGSNDAHRRDEFTLDIRAQQYKELLDRESFYMSKYTHEQRQRNALNNKNNFDSNGDSLDSLDEELKRAESREKRQNSKLFQTQVPKLLYDIGRDESTYSIGSNNSIDYNNNSSLSPSGITPICNKCNRNSFYCPHRSHAYQQESHRRKGTYKTSSDAIGYQCQKIDTQPTNRIKSRQF